MLEGMLSKCLKLADASGVSMTAAYISTAIDCLIPEAAKSTILIQQTELEARSLHDSR
jgi:hypothetical protein